MFAGSKKKKRKSGFLLSRRNKGVNAAFHFPGFVRHFTCYIKFRPILMASE